MMIYLMGFMINMLMFFVYNRLSSSDKMGIMPSLILSLFSWVMVSILLIIGFVGAIIGTVELFENKKWYIKIQNFWEGV